MLADTEAKYGVPASIIVSIAAAIKGRPHCRVRSAPAYSFFDLTIETMRRLSC
jgi:hypothetical protein